MAFALPFLGSSKCVLLLNDEGLGIYSVSSGRIELVDTIVWDVEGFEDVVASTVRRSKCAGKPIVMLNDMVEQHYRKEKVPRIGGLDKASIIQRRLAAAFSNYPMRAALKLKEKSAPARGETASDVYLFAAVPLLDNVRKTMSAVKRLHGTVQGFTLLPIESSSMVAQISKKLDKLSDGGAATWTVFVGQHRSGGLRQVVTRKGELALTRMTPIIDSDSNPDLWASEVVGEIKGTMSYLSRFGYDPSDGLDVVVIADESASGFIESLVDFDCNLHVLSAAQAGALIGCRLGANADTRYADVLHAGWVGQKSTPLLPLKAAIVDSITMPARAATVASVLLLLSSVYFGISAFSSSKAWMEHDEQREYSQRELTQIQQEYDNEIEAKRKLGIDIHLIEGATAIYDELELGSMKPLKVLEVLGASLGPDIHISSFEIKSASGSTDTSSIEDADGAEPEPEIDPETGDAVVRRAKPKPKEFTLVLKIVFPGKLEPESGVRHVNELRNRLQTNLPSHKIAVIKQVADLSYTGNFVGEAKGQNITPSGTPEEYEAQISITGVML